MVQNPDVVLFVDRDAYSKLPFVSLKLHTTVYSVDVFVITYYINASSGIKMDAVVILRLLIVIASFCHKCLLVVKFVVVVSDVLCRGVVNSGCCVAATPTAVVVFGYYKAVICCLGY